MNQQVSSAPVVLKNPGKIKTVIISVIIVTIVILSAIIGFNIYSKRQAEIQAANAAKIIQLMFDSRTKATAFYAVNKSYKDWAPTDSTLTQVTELGSTIVFRKPDFQNYILYAYIPATKKFFCIDTHQFADTVNQVSANQSKCEN